METYLNTGGNNASASDLTALQSLKHVTCSTPRMLTASEIKLPTLHSFSAPKRSVAATRCRQILANLKGNLSQTIQEEREDRV